MGTVANTQKDPNVNDKQEVKKANDQEIENVKDEEGKNVEDQQDSEGDDDTNNDDVGYMRQPIEDETWFITHEIDYPNVNEKKADHGYNKTEGKRRVLCYVQGSGRGKRVLAATTKDETALFLEP
ncbi:hypothetical protein Tco_0642313 [Tanacetum coccineum]